MSNLRTPAWNRSLLGLVALVALALTALLASSGAMAADDADQASIEERVAALEAGNEKASWTEKIELLGDFRLRYEGFYWPGTFDDGRRDRFRYRLRFGVKANLHEKLQLGIELRSGNFRDPVSDNTSFDGAGTKDEIAIAQAYAHYRPYESFWLRAGKFAPGKLWHVSDLQWDDDAVVNGLMVAYDHAGEGAVKHVDVRGYTFILEENSSTGDANWYGIQGGPTFALSEKDTLLVGAGYDHIVNPVEVAKNSEGFTDDALFGGNAVTNLVIFEDGEAQALVSDFKIGTLYAEWKNKSSKAWPLKASLFYYKNFGAGDEVGIDPAVGVSSASTGKDNDTGWFFRFQVGDYKKFKQMAFRYSRYDSKPDALFYAFTQSDTVRGSNVAGNRVDFRIGMPLRSYINVTWYNVKPNTGEQQTMDRWQFDYIFRF